MPRDEYEYEWDEDKSEANRQKRGFGFERIYDFDFAIALIAPDERKDYGELRFRAVGRIEGAAHMVVFTPRGTKLRIISMRRMHEEEAKRYGI